MAKYSDIKGFTVQTLSSDPVATLQDLGSWASGGALNTARYAMGYGGTQTSALMFGGDSYPTSPRLNAITESYNGTSYTEVADLNTARRLLGGAGASNTAAIAMGGYSPPGYKSQTETWNGSAWTEVSELNTGRQINGLGISTAALGIGGEYSGNPTPRAGLTESWDGSSWTEVADLNTSRKDMGGAGLYTAGLVYGGDGPSYTNLTESWDGTNWTETGDLNTTRRELRGGGTYTDAIGAGGEISTAAVTGNTEAWNGSTWAEVADLANGVKAAGSAQNGTSSATLLSGGITTAKTTLTEEWTVTATTFTKQVEGQLFFNSTTNTFKETVKDPTAGTWASSGGLNENRATCGGSGVQTAAIYFGGPEPSYGGKTETYNGSSFTEVADLNTGRVYGMPSGNGTTTATICSGGESPIRALTESWDGSSWTEVNDLNTARYGGLGAGTATAAIVASGYRPPPPTPVYKNECELWDGTSWTEVNNVNTARYVGCGFGLQTTAIFAGGNVPPNNTSPAIESWDGTSWTEITELNTSRQQGGSAGATGTDGLVYGGRTAPSTPGDIASTEYWNGSSWTEIADMAIARGLIAQQQGMSPLASLAVNATPPSPTSEEFTSVGLGNKTITAS